MMKNLFLFLLVASFILVFSACEDPRDDACYDADLAFSMIDSTCISTCPGVCACNFVTYCNECEAMKAGYAVAIGDSLPCGQ